MADVVPGNRYPRSAAQNKPVPISPTFGAQMAGDAGVAFMPGSGVADAMFGTPMLTQGGEKTKTMWENIKMGEVADALLQLGGVAGDAMYLAGPLGMAAGGSVKSAVKAAQASRRAKTFGAAVELGPSDKIGSGLDSSGWQQMGHNQGPPMPGPDAMNVLDARAEQMKLSKSGRVQPSGDPYFENSPEAYLDPQYMPEQRPIPLPRRAEGTKLPKGERAKILEDRREEIAQLLAQKMEPHKGTAAQYFYHTGPIRKKAQELGLSGEEADNFVREFAQAYAATSPRTETAQNIRNATMVMFKKKYGLPLNEPITPVIGATGKAAMNDKGYPMMVGPTGIHRRLSNDAFDPGTGLSFDRNTKPATFGQNVYGNHTGATVDTHAIRGVFQALNEIEPGSIPMEFIKKDFRDAYRADPSGLNPATWIDDSLASTTRKGKKQQVEYPVFNDIYARAAEILGVSPAEAQSLGWFGSGESTGLMSEMKTVVDLLSDRIDVTSQISGMPRDEVFKRLMKSEIPLASVAGGAVALPVVSSAMQDRERNQQ
jgi:hypothetical protein